MPNTFLNIIQIVLSGLVIVIILMQVKGQGSGLFGSGDSSFRTRRGIELTLFRFTILLIGAFIIVSIISARSV